MIKTLTKIVVVAAAFAGAAASPASATTVIKYEASGIMSGTRIDQPLNGPGIIQSVTGRSTITYLLPASGLTSPLATTSYFMGGISAFLATPSIIAFGERGYAGAGRTGVISALTCLSGGAVNASCGASQISDGGRLWSLDLLGTIDSLSISVVNNSSAQFGLVGYRFDAAAVPEPATWAMMLVGFAMLGAAMRRRPNASLTARPATVSC